MCVSCVHAYVYMRVSVYVHVYMHACMHVCVYVSVCLLECVTVFRYRMVISVIVINFLFEDAVYSIFSLDFCHHSTY